MVACLLPGVATGYVSSCLPDTACEIFTVKGELGDYLSPESGLVCHHVKLCRSEDGEINAEERVQPSVVARGRKTLSKLPMKIY